MFSTIQDQQSAELSQGHVAKRAKRLRVERSELKLPRVTALDACQVGCSQLPQQPPLACMQRNRMPEHVRSCVGVSGQLEVYLLSQIGVLRSCASGTGAT